MKGSGWSIVDEIVYMASLATHAADVDSLLDPMRSVTAQAKYQDSQTDIAESDQATLRKVKSDIETWLVENEQVRQFSLDSLRERVQRRMKGDNPQKALRFTLAGVWALAIGAAAFPYIVPIVSTDSLTQQLSTSLLFATLLLGAAWFFFAAIKDVKPGIRQAYGLISTAVVLAGLTQLLQPMIDLFGARQTPLATIAITSSISPFVILMYLGVRKYAQLVGITSRAAKLPLIGGLMAAGAIAAIFAPHNPIDDPEFVFDISLAIQAMIAVPAVGSVILLFRVKKYASKLYAVATTKLWHSSLCSAFIALYAVALMPVVGVAGTPKGAVFIIGMLAFVASGLLLLRAGYAFNKANVY